MLIVGRDVTMSLTARAVKMQRRRTKRGVHDNSVSTKFDDPRTILLNDQAKPPSVWLSTVLH